MLDFIKPIRGLSIGYLAEDGEGALGPNPNGKTKFFFPLKRRGKT
jgi:hypothetical protein